MLELANYLLSIPSPTFDEDLIASEITKWVQKHLKSYDVVSQNNSLIIKPKSPATDKPHYCLVGHSDVVPKWFDPYIDGDLLHGSGASDMKVSVACYMALLRDFESSAQLSLIVYAREEGTAVEDNGLYELIQNYPDYFKSIDLAIVGEPTDMTIQLGCVGSIHSKVTIMGERAHSARPWNGRNALYEAAPFISYMRDIQRNAHKLFGVTFYDVVQITESQSEPGTTTLPGFWECNVNFRYAPIYTPEEAGKHLEELLLRSGVPISTKLVSNAYAGRVIESDLFTSFIEAIDTPIEAKQAWTDVAQLTQLGIPAFNYGPGLTQQAHKENEYIKVSDTEAYYEKLKNYFEGVL